MTVLTAVSVAAQTGTRQPFDGPYISPSRPVTSGLAPSMKVKLVMDTPQEKVYSIVFSKGDEALSGLTDFAKKYHVVDGHFTAIGAVSSATVAWLDLSIKKYHRISIPEQVEVLSMVGDISTYQGKPMIHMHAVFARHDGSTIGGHIFEANVNPTLEVFVTAYPTPLERRPDDASGMKVIEPTM
ncbi:DNA-binding protein [Acidipila sp. 4G-K13]|uniref:DUF296 domain-containing protein n=2 Tax=Paracidobacterium acidisoli TaxID=2303751 RepID=A0A372ISW3_9BACT|nr:DNA-binding protein [Paracidobacterium acidisoli]